jgi:hypothetical protein
MISVLVFIIILAGYPSDAAVVSNRRLQFYLLSIISRFAMMENGAGYEGNPVGHHRSDGRSIVCERR